jgi:FtsP/CotA-like multicopper oxidase with cupredoxin domain
VAVRFAANWPDVFQIGSDGGYLAAPVKLDMTPVEDSDGDDNSAKLLLAPAERADIVVDFSGLAPGTTLAFTNDAKAPFPDDDDPNMAELGQILQFHVLAPKGSDASSVPTTLNPLSTRLDPKMATVVRHLVLTEVEDPASGNPVVGLLNNTCWDGPITELPTLGTTEIWEISDTTGDTHPIHLHLVQFNLLDRQDFDVAGYLEEWNDTSPLGGNLPARAPTCPSSTEPLTSPGVAAWPQVIPAVDPFLVGTPVPPAPNEAWKDTVRVKEGTVTRLLVRFAPQDPAAKGPYGGFSFDPTAGKYVWHCHILEHEDNEMMRPYQITK